MTPIDEIKTAVDIVELIEETTALKKSGHAYTGFCPFHNNTKTPALAVWPETGTWRCFGNCNTGGSVFDWVMQRDNTDFGGALKTLAGVAGIELDASPEAAAKRQRRGNLIETLTFSADYFHTQLWLDDPASRHALETRGRRGLPDNALHHLKWGYSRGDDGLMRAMMDARPDLIPVAREYGIIRRDGRDFTVNSDGDKISPNGFIIYPHFERGNPAGNVVYLSSRSVDNPKKGSKSRNLPGVVDIQPYLLLVGTSRRDEQGKIKIGKLADDIIVTEGPADAATVWALGWPAAALMKQSYNPKFTWLKKHLQRQAGRGRRVIVALSNDAQGVEGALGQWKNGERKPGVCEAITPLAEILLWPKPQGADKSDANSWYQDGGDAESLQRLTERTKTFINLMIEQTARLTRQTRQIKHLADLVSRLGEDDRADFSAIITGDRNIKINKTDFQRYVREAMRSRNGSAAPVEIINGQFTDYGTPLASCLIKITHQQLVHAKSADEVKIRYLIKGIHPANRPLKDVEVLADEFEDFKWMAKNWGIDGYVMVGRNKLTALKNAVLNYSMGDIRREEIYSYTGWETINGKRGFLSASGFLTAEGLDSSIKIELDGTQKKYALPEPPDEVSIIEAIESSLSFLNVGPDSITVPILLAQYAAALRPLQSFNALFTIYGPSQTKKSNVSHLALCHWGDFLRGLSRRDYSTVIDAASTPIMFQQYNHILSDTVVVVDDIPPGSSRFEIVKQRQKVETLAREIGNRAGRERWGFASLPPNVGICMITAEKLAVQVGSAMNRSYVIEFGRDDIDTAQLSQAQQVDSHRYAQAMAGYIQWLAQNWDELETSLPERVRAFQAEIIERYTQPRLHDYYATLMVAGASLLAWARDANLIDAQLEAEYLQRFREGIMVNLDKMEERIAEMQFSKRFFETLVIVLIQKPYALMPIGGRIYIDEQGLPQTTFNPPPGTPLLGWLVPEEGQIWLHDVEALKTVKRHLQEMDDFLDVSTPDLRKEFDYLNLLAEVESYTRKKSGRPVVQLTPKKSIPGRGWVRVLVINARAVRNTFDIDFFNNEPDLA